MMTSRRIRIDVPALTRVEGEGSLRLRIEGGRISQLQLKIFEPPRYFEKFLEGRSWQEVPDLVARICGICPVAYQLTAIQALEQAFAVRPRGPWSGCVGCSIAANGCRAMPSISICWPCRIIWASTA